MSNGLYVCVYAAEFPAQALMRLRSDLHSLPVVVLQGRAPLEQVCAMNRQARRLGASPGMTRHEAEALQGPHVDLRLLSRSLESEAAARAVLLEYAANFSPRIEETSRGTDCAFILDIAGTERLFGPPRTLAERLRSALAAVGFRVSVAVSANFHAARMIAEASHGITVIPSGGESAALANLPIELIEMPTQHIETLATWGIRTLGEFAALPLIDLIARLGQDAAVWRNLALGVQDYTFQPLETAFSLREFCEFETPVEQVDSLLFMGARMIDSLVARACARAMCIASAAIHLALEGGGEHQLTLHPALPSADRKFLLKLMQLEITAHPPQAAVVSITLTAEAGQSAKVQLGLFAPQTPEPSHLDVTIARLKAIAGEDRVGSPVLEDTHRPGSFHVSNFSAGSASANQSSNSPRMALRRLRPPLPVRVSLREGQPVFIHDGRRVFKINASFGPWRSSGCWWSAGAWDCEEWDILAVENGGGSVACVLICDRMQNTWRLEAFYD